MVIKFNKKNPLIDKLFSKKYKQKIVKSKKGKGSFKRLKNIRLTKKISVNLNNDQLYKVEF